MHDQIARDAVGELGQAVFESTTMPCPHGGEATVARLCADAGLLESVPTLRHEHDRARSALERSLDRIWPRSSQNRPRDCVEALQACEGISILASLPEGAVARRLSALPSRASERLITEARHVTELEARLKDLGVSDEAGDTWDAAVLLDKLHVEHGVRTPDEATGAVDHATREAARLAAAALSGRRVGMAAGLARATSGQILALGRCLAAAPLPWLPGLVSAIELDAILGKVEAAATNLRRARDAATALDARFGTAWRSEDPGKMNAAASILSTDGDRRQASAARYADGLGVSSDQAAVLTAMAKASSALVSRALPASLARAIAPVTGEGPPDLDAAVSHLRSLCAWRKGVERSESLTMAIRAVDSLGPEERADVLRHVTAYEANALPLNERDAKRTISDLSDEAAGRSQSLSLLTGALSAFPVETVQQARRVARLIRERRQAYERMSGDPAYASVEARSPSEVSVAYAWGEALKALLPQGLDPCMEGMADNLARLATGAGESASTLSDVLSRVQDIAGTADMEFLETLAQAAWRSRRLATARAAVTEADAWDLVARLEEEGMEPGLWADAVAGLGEATVTVVAPIDDLPEIPAHEPLAKSLPAPAFDFRDEARWVRCCLVRTDAKLAA